MTATSWAVFCLVYGVGLLLTGLPGQWGGIPITGWGLLSLGGIAFIWPPRCWRTKLQRRDWLIAGLIGFLATLYMQVATPQPGATDISQLLGNASPDEKIAVTVQGRIQTPPRLTRSQRIQFELNVSNALLSSAEPPSPEMTGTVYVTVPLLQGTGLYPGQQIQVTGSLYEPKPAANPGGFDFQKYLRQQGIFAGLNGDQVEGLEEPGLTPIARLQKGLWSIRQRILKAQVNGLGVPEGPLLSAMVMGKNGVDLSFQIRDQFSQVGLAHALAASGFQVSLLIGVMVSLTRQWSNRLSFWISLGVVVAYIGLTGIQPAVLRAGVMGAAVLGATMMDRRVKPLGLLLVAATLLLLYNPLWIWDLGFQFSFLATLGLLVTVPILTDWFDWLPVAIAPLLTVPLAAYLWTLPLQLLVFGVVSPYSIPINLVTTPLVTLISIGGIVSALAALLYPPLGSLTAWLLYYPTTGLIQIAALGSQWPGSSYAVGTIALLEVFAIYGLFLVIWWCPRWQRYWWVAAALSISLVAIPVWYSSSQLLRVTVLSTGTDPVMVIQDQHQVGLINSTNESTTTFTLLPFLRQHGINRLNWAIAPELSPFKAAQWITLLQSIPVQSLYGVWDKNAPPPDPTPGRPSQLFLYRALLQALHQHQGQYHVLSGNQPIALGAFQVQPIAATPGVLQLQVGSQTWLLLNRVEPATQRTLITQLPQADVLWWSGAEPESVLLNTVKPRVAIASTPNLSSALKTSLQTQSIALYSTVQEGAIQWSHDRGFTALLPVD